MTSASTSLAGGDLGFDVVNHVAVITLNRAHALNALTLGMLQALASLLDACEHDPGIRAVALRGSGPKAFCAGGDVLALADSVREGSALRREFFIAEYRLDHRLHRFPKPVVTLVHGIAMGGGMGLVQGAALRLVGPKARLAMPETRIGLVPDVGATHFFSRMPAPLALYLALCGTMLGAADALFCGLADAHARADQPEDFVASLRDIAWDGDPVHALRLALAAPQGTSIEGATLPGLSPAIFHHFDPARTVTGVIDSLGQEHRPAWTTWAHDTRRALLEHSPLMLTLCREALLRSRRWSLAECFRMEFNLVQHALASGEFSEGVRALLIDKDQQPRWSPDHLDSVDPQQVQRCFAPDTAWGPHPLADLDD